MNLSYLHKISGRHNPPPCCNGQIIENRALRPRLRKIHSENKIIGRGRPLLRVMELADSYAKSDFPVLITGESGTGKELIAKRVHQLSNRKGMPFLASFIL